LSGAKLEQAMLIANQVRTAVEALRFHFRGTPVRVTVSCGLTQLKENDVADAAFDRAPRHSRLTQLCRHAGLGLLPEGRVSVRHQFFQGVAALE